MSVGIIIPNIWKKCSKPPTSYTVFYKVSHQCTYNGGEPQNRLALSSFEPTLQSSTMICTIHGFTARVFTPPSGEQGRLRRTNNPEEHTLAGSQICLFGFEHFVQSFKGPSKKLKPVKPSARKAHYHAASCAMLQKKIIVYLRFQ